MHVTYILSLSHTDTQIHTHLHTRARARWEALQDPRAPKLLSSHSNLQLLADPGGLDPVGLVLGASSGPA